MKFKPLKQLDVDFDKSSKFWEQSADERFEYFKNATYSYILFLKNIQLHTSDQELADMAALQFASVCTLLVYLMTTDEERANDIEMVWFERLQKETDDLLMVTNQETGKA